MLRLEGVSKSYGALPAVRDISFSARRGEVLGYLGPNGSGKSTTVKMVAGLLTPTKGRITFDGRDIEDDPLAHRDRVGYVPETPHLYSYLTGPEYLSLVGGLRQMPAQRVDEKVERFLQAFELEGDRYQPIASYSKGMKQKISLAAALLHDPEIVILDEPSSGLDVGSTLILKQLIKSLASDGKLVLYSSHVLEIVEQVCDRAVILRDGELVAEGSVAELSSLMKEPSLEHVFKKLAKQRDEKEAAQDLLAAMKL